MNFSKIISVVAITTLLAGSGFAQTEIVITGATAFRASANNAIIQLLGGPTAAEYAYVGTQGIDGTNRAIFRGNIGSDPYVIRVSWSGSTAGIAAVANNTPVEVLLLSEPTAVGGVQVPGTPSYVFVPAAFAFSDVAQASSTTLSPTLVGSEVGVVPFQFVASRTAPASLENMTDQIMEALYSSSEVPLYVFTGDLADTDTVYAVGRNNGSGSRATVLAETGYGVFQPVAQYQPTLNKPDDDDPSTWTVTGFGALSNGGFSSNSFIRDVVQADASAFGIFLSYLTGSDAVVATSNGALGLTYNGMEFTTDNILNGPYTLWGYQWFYQNPSITAEEATFGALFEAAIPATLTDPLAAIPIPDMNVTRFGGDGGVVLPD